MKGPELTGRCLILLLAAASGVFAQYQTLFDGKSFHNFRTPTGETGPEVSWRIAGGAIESLPGAVRQCDLWTARPYRNYDLEFDWRVGPNGNSGIKYLIQASAVDRLKHRDGSIYYHETSLGYEFQLVAGPPGQAPDTHVSGALYNYLAPSEVPVHPVGEWNTGRLMVDGRHVEHWINGHRVLSYSLDSPQLKAALRARHVNSAHMMDELKNRVTAIAFQHHNSAVAFRNIRIKVLPD